jgi:hypothetical protein
MCPQAPADPPVARVVGVDPDELDEAGLSDIAAAYVLEDAPLDPYGNVAPEAVAEFLVFLWP